MKQNILSPSQDNEWTLLVENSSTKPSNIFKFVREGKGDIFRIRGEFYNWKKSQG